MEFALGPNSTETADLIQIASSDNTATQMGSASKAAKSGRDALLTRAVAGLDFAFTKLLYQCTGLAKSSFQTLMRL
jgi:hypothetical protein